MMAPRMVALRFKKIYQKKDIKIIFNKINQGKGSAIKSAQKFVKEIM